MRLERGLTTFICVVGHSTTLGGIGLLLLRMDDAELERCYAALGVEPGAGRDALKKALMQKSYALIRGGGNDAERDRLRAAHDAIIGHLDLLEVQERQAARVEARAEREVAEAEQLVALMEKKFAEPEVSAWDPRSFDSRFVNLLTLPLVALGAILIEQTPLAFFLTGFHVWIHEFGHATIGWMTGHRALPLPLGWTPIAEEKSLFVYWGILFLFGVLFVAGWRERKPWPMIFAVVLAALQWVMTWKLPQTTVDMWISFCGVGGEFYLSAAMVCLFYFQLTKKFRWGGCRYFFLFIGAGSFYFTFTRWQRIYSGAEDIPYGSMINGEEDAGGDMNGLHAEFGWTQHDIRFTYHHLGNACLAVMIGFYLFFALRFDRVLMRAFKREA